jgi:hypothetical protein
MCGARQNARDETIGPASWINISSKDDWISGERTLTGAWTTFNERWRATPAS